MWCDAMLCGARRVVSFDVLLRDAVWCGAGDVCINVYVTHACVYVCTRVCMHCNAVFVRMHVCMHVMHVCMSCHVM